MPLDFNDLIPGATALKEKGSKQQRPGPSWNELIQRGEAPKSTAMDFEDLVPKGERVAFPKASQEMLEAARIAMSDKPLPGKPSPGMEKLATGAQSWLGEDIGLKPVAPRKRVQSRTVATKRLPSGRSIVEEIDELIRTGKAGVMSLPGSGFKRVPKLRPPKSIALPEAKKPIGAAKQVKRPAIDYGDLLGKIPLISPPATADPSAPQEGIVIPEKPKALKGKKPIGVKEQARRIDWTERGPFSLVGLLKATRLREAIGRLQKGDYEAEAEQYNEELRKPEERLKRVRPDGTPEFETRTRAELYGGFVKPEDLKATDKKLVSDYLKRVSEESERGMTFGAKVLTGVSFLPAWMIEFMATGGLKTIGSKAVERIGKKVLGKWAATKAGQAALKTGQWLGGAAVRTTVGMPHRVGEEIIKRRIPQKMHFGPNGEFVVEVKPERWATSIAKGWGDVFIEAASEEAGATITKGLSGAINKMPFGKPFLTGLRKAWVKLKPGNKMWDFWQKVFAKGGYSNIIGEIGEERLATIMHSIANTQDFGTGKDSGVFDRLAAGLTQDVKNFPVEVTVLSAPAATRYALAKATGAKTKPPVLAPESLEEAIGAAQIQKPAKPKPVVKAKPRVSKVKAIKPPVKSMPAPKQAYSYSSKDNAQVAKQKFDAFWKWHKEAGHGDKPADLKDAIFDYLTEQQEYQDIEQPLFELDDKGQYNSPEGKRLQAKLDKMRADLERNLREPGKKAVAPKSKVEPTAKKIEPLKEYKTTVPLPTGGTIGLKYQYVEYPKHGQHRYNFNWDFKKGRELFGAVNFDAPATEVEAAGGPAKFAARWAAQALGKTENITRIETSIGTIEIPSNELDIKWDKALEVIFDYGNQTAAGKPVQPGLPRSLSMGDTVEYEGKTWLVMPQGWQDVSQLTPEQIDKLVGSAKIPLPPKAKAAKPEKKIEKAEVKKEPGPAKSLETIKKEGEKPADTVLVRPREVPARVIKPAKGKKILRVDLNDKDETITFTDFGTGIAAKGKTLYHLATQTSMAEFKSVQAARKAATTLATETGINFKDKDFSKVLKQFEEWLERQGVGPLKKGTALEQARWNAERKEKIKELLTGQGKELDAGDYLRQFPKLKKPGLEKSMKGIEGWIKGFAKAVPEFTLNPTFTFEKESGQLVFKDRYRFAFYPEVFGLDHEQLKDGQTIRFDLESFGIKPAKAKELKKAEAFLGEKKILGRTTKKPTPVKLYGEPKKKLRKPTKAYEAYSSALRELETGKEVEGGKAVTEDDVRRAAQLGKKARQQQWTVEKEILMHQKWGGESLGKATVSIPKVKEIVRSVFTEKAGEIISFEDLVPVAKRKPAAKTTKAEKIKQKLPELERQRYQPADTLKNVVVDRFREWPKQIPKVGKDFWVELMAAAKQILTPYRYKALRQTMLGAFRFRKGLGAAVPAKVVGIEVQDVRDALTAIHELGHNLDWLLNNKKFPSSIKARFDTEAKEKALRDELKKVSKVLRPDLWRAAEKSQSRKRYISQHSELMADFISHYILDPEKTRELAPDMTEAFEAKFATKPELFEIISRLQESRYEGPEEPPIAEHIREHFPLPKEMKPLKLAFDMTDKGYVKAAEELGITAARHYKLLIHRAHVQSIRIDKLVPSKARQTDLVVIAEKGTKNPWTDKTREQILKEGLTENEKKAIKLYRAYQELARQTVNKYLRGADIAEYISFIEDYFIHAYKTPMTEKYKSAISRWAKRSPQAKKRVLPSLAEAVELGLRPRAKTLSEGLMLWAGINYRVATNKAFLRVLPKITNEDGLSILQKPQEFPMWPTVDYWPIRQNYAVPLPGRGVLLFQGRIAVDPKVKPFIDAMFGRRVFSTPVRIIEGLNAIWKGFQLTVFSFFHHQAEFFSAAGSLGPRAMPFVGGYYGKKARAFGEKPKLWGLLPAHITTLKAGKQLEESPEFMEDYLAHGGQRGYIGTEGRNLLERMLKNAEDYVGNMMRQTKALPVKGVFAAAYVPVKTASAAYTFHQRLLWDNVQRAKLVAYYNIVADGAKYSDLPMDKVKDTAAKYIADNFGGQEWLNTMFRNPKVRQFWTQLMMSLDWTWSQIKTARWPFMYGGKTSQERARRAFMRKIGRHHWFWYLSAIASFSIAGSYAINGKGPWDNEYGHKLDIDWTKIWRALPWNRDWKKRGDYSRRYISLGKAGRELVRWVTSPLRAFGYKLSPVARSVFEQGTGHNLGSDWPEPWAREDLEFYQEVYARFKHLMDNFKPFSLSGNNAFLALPSRKGMTNWKAIRAFEELFEVRANIASGGLTAKLTKVSHILDKDREKLTGDIVRACKLNNVGWEKALSAALSNTRSKYYGRFWHAAKDQDVKKTNRYADALIALGVTEQGFIQSMTERGRQLSKEAMKLGIDTFLKR